MPSSRYDVPSADYGSGLFFLWICDIYGVESDIADR